MLTGYLAPHTFRIGSFSGQFADIFTGMMGGYLAEVFLRLASGSILKHEKGILRIIAFLAAFSYSFTWVGFYRYRYNIPYFNFPGINLATLVFWTSGAYTTIIFFQFLKRRNILIRLLITWPVYILVLFSVEFIGYSIFRLHENSVRDAKAMAFGLIHGTNILHFFYLTSPIFTIGLFCLFKWLIYRSISNVPVLSVNNISN